MRHNVHSHYCSYTGHLIRTSILINSAVAVHVLMNRISDLFVTRGHVGGQSILGSLTPSCCHPSRPSSFRLPRRSPQWPGRYPPCLSAGWPMPELASFSSPPPFSSTPKRKP